MGACDFYSRVKAWKVLRTKTRSKTRRAAVATPLSTSSTQSTHRPGTLRGSTIPSAKQANPSFQKRNPHPPSFTTQQNFQRPAPTHSAATPLQQQEDGCYLHSHSECRISRLKPHTSILKPTSGRRSHLFLPRSRHRRLGILGSPPLCPSPSFQPPADDVSPTRMFFASVHPSCSTASSPLSD